MGEKYKEISAIARKRRDDQLAAAYSLPEIDETRLPKDLRNYQKESGLFLPQELEILDMDAVTIVQKIRDRKLTSVEVTKAFCKAAAVAQKLTNCVTEVLFAEGLKRAKYLDEYLEKTGTVVGPLHGLPVSLKDNFMTPPHPSSIGMAVHANVPTEKESVLVTMLRDLGAVFYVKTNVPTAMMMAETTNNIWGETRNPIHKGLSPGGSSGGEAALIAMKASPLGVGTDIGGSIRIPSAWCHLYGLKPSFGRFPTWGGRPSMPGQDFIYAICGPMSRSLRSLRLFCEAVCSEQAAPWNLDPKILPIPWRKNMIQPSGRKLRLGLISGDGIVTPHPPVQRALEIVRKVLKEAGHDVIDWAPIDHAAIVETVSEGFRVLGSDIILSQMREYDEPIFNAIKQQYEIDDPNGPGLGPDKLREMILKRNQLQKDYLDRWMATQKDNERPIDGIISPVAPTAANRLGFAQREQYVGYTSVFNLLDLPSCTFPVTYASQTIDVRRGDEWQPLSDLDKLIQDEYDPEFYDGAPVSLQLAGKRLEEEKVLEMVEVVSNALKAAGY